MMKPGLSRHIVIILVVACLVGGTGYFLAVPPQFVDAITGATRDSHANDELKGDYIIASAKSPGKQGILSVCEDESDLYKFARAEQKKYEGECEVRSYSKTMLRSRMLAGKDDEYIFPMGFIDTGLLDQNKYDIKTVGADEIKKNI